MHSSLLAGIRAAGAAALFSVASSAHADIPSIWRGRLQQDRRIDIELIRGSVRVERIDGETSSIHVVTSGAGGEQVRVGAALNAQGVRVQDIYPQTSSWRVMRECLPPMPERGDFWLSAARVDLLVRAPDGVDVQVHVAEQP